MHKRFQDLLPNAVTANPINFFQMTETMSAMKSMRKIRIFCLNILYIFKQVSSYQEKDENFLLKYL